MLYAAFRAFGQLPPLAVLIQAYFVGLLGNLLPLPGGIGGVDGGMIGALVAFGVSGSLALIAVLTYRFFAFWLPTIPGVIAYFCVLSFFLICLERLSIRSAYSLAAWALILGPLLWTTRNDFSNFFRPAAWGLLTLAAMRLFSEAYSKFFKKRNLPLSKLNSALVRAKHV